MGLRESKISFFPYEEVQRRVNEDELKRLRLAFKRIAGASGVMAKSSFFREVLGESVPPKLAEQMFIAFGGGSKGIYFKDLLCGLALLTRGSLMDKLRFIFEIYSSDGNHVLQDDMESLLLASEGGKVPESIRQLFALSDKVTSQDFCDWLRRHPDSITLSKWLVKQGNGLQLTDYGETPTFYQTLAKFTGLQELDIIELEKRYWYLKSGTKTGKFDLETFMPLVSSCVSDSLAKALFNAFDENQDGHIDFREIACGISTCCRGPVAERFAFTFKIFDVDRDGRLSEDEIRTMIKTMIELKSENIPHSPMGKKEVEIDPEILVTDVLSDYDSDKDGFVTLDEYKKWATSQSLSRLVLDILFQICHVVFGLRPATRKDEYQVIWGWLDRENFRGLQPGTTWFLVAMEWWKKWKEFIGRQKSTVARSLSTSALEKNGVSPLSSTLSSSASQAWDRMESSQRKVMVGRRLSQPQRSVAPLVDVNGINISKPGTIDNSCLVEQDVRKIQSLTADGGKLKCSVPLVRGRDFEIVPESVWKALVQWYTGSPALPRN
ncbi:Ubiquitin carboxyl-terminal hydrolase 32, partial [Paramuricea clavata]